MGKLTSWGDNEVGSMVIGSVFCPYFPPRYHLVVQWVGVCAIVIVWPWVYLRNRSVVLGTALLLL